MSTVKPSSSDQLESELRSFGSALRAAVDSSLRESDKDRVIRSALSKVNEERIPRAWSLKITRALLAPQLAAAFVVVLTVALIAERSTRPKRMAAHSAQTISEMHENDLDDTALLFDGEEDEVPSPLEPELEDEAGLSDESFSFPDIDFNLNIEGEIL